MKNLFLLSISLLLLFLNSGAQDLPADPSTYLNDIKTGLHKEWPANKTVNLVFHGHSVPAGYFKTPVVNTLDSYPYQVLKKLKEQYPFAVINIINTAIGGENSLSGSKRFKKDVLVHNPDVIFIDYALNDVGIGLKKSEKAWSSMIRRAIRHGIKIILLTPSPDQRINILEPNNELEKHARQIRSLAIKYKIGLTDSYELFKRIALSGEKLELYMSQVNHPNERGHEVIANQIIEYFK